MGRQDVRARRSPMEVVGVGTGRARTVGGERRRTVGPEDYFATALALLATEGPAALRMRTLCERLGVTWGSFYHHFRDLAEFRTRLLAWWETTATGTVVADAAVDVLDVGLVRFEAFGLNPHRHAVALPRQLDVAADAGVVQGLEVGAEDLARLQGVGAAGALLLFVEGNAVRPHGASVFLFHAVVVRHVIVFGIIHRARFPRIK